MPLAPGFFIAFVFLLAASELPETAHTQQAPALTGIVQAPSGAPVGFAALTRHRAADSVLVKSECGDMRGAFRFEALMPRCYMVSAAQVGY